jgi:hypothetical protein
VLGAEQLAAVLGREQRLPVGSAPAPDETAQRELIEGAAPEAALRRRRQVTEDELERVIEFDATKDVLSRGGTELLEVADRSQQSLRGAVDPRLLAALPAGSSYGVLTYGCSASASHGLSLRPQRRRRMGFAAAPI